MTRFYVKSDLCIARMKDKLMKKYKTKHGCFTNEKHSPLAAHAPCLHSRAHPVCKWFYWSPSTCETALETHCTGCILRRERPLSQSHQRSTLSTSPHGSVCPQQHAYTVTMQHTWLSKRRMRLSIASDAALRVKDLASSTEIKNICMHIYMEIKRNL